MQWRKPTILWLIWWSAGTATGCATAPVELPAWDDLTPASSSVSEPLPLPALPALQQNGDLAQLDRAGLQQLEAFVISAEANTRIAAENAAALRDLGEAYNRLLEAGRYQREVAIIRQELLELERRDHMLDNWYYRGALVFVLLAAVTL